MRGLPLFLLLSAAPALADVVPDTDNADDTAEEDKGDDGGCASAPVAPEGLASVALGVALLAGLRRQR